jgi:Ca-activated chloride channel homolog
MRWLLVIAVAAATGLLASAQDLIKVDVEVVQVYAAVTDAKGRFVTDLKSADFKVSENGAGQKIEAFSSDDTPLSVAILFGAGGTIGGDLPLAKLAALSFLKASHLENEYFVVEFNNKPQLTQDYTHDVTKLKNHVLSLHGTRDAGDYDAIYLALEKLRDAANPRKVLLMFTSGGDVKGEHSLAEVRDLARQLDVQIFGITATDVDVHGNLVRTTDGFEVIQSSGGEVLVPDSAADFLNTGRRIAVALRNQYILGYRSTNPAHDGKYRQLEVKLNVPGVPELIVHTRNGYYAKSPEGQIALH